MSWWRGLFAPRPSHEPVETWAVQFDDGGQTYTYRRTQHEFMREMRDRYLLRGELPHQVQVVRSGELHTVEFDLGEYT